MEGSQAGSAYTPATRPEPRAALQARTHVQRCCKDLQGPARTCEELRGAARSCTELQGAARRCKALLPHVVSIGRIKGRKEGLERGGMEHSDRHITLAYNWRMP